MSKYFAKYLPVEERIIPHKSRVKLFLCSRDIQIGQRVWDSQTSERYNKVEYEESTSWACDSHSVDSSVGNVVYTVPKERAIIVIGEISPEARWVKEGDEFDEEEVHRCFVHENVSILSDPMKRKVQIKGPCGHFH